MTNENIEDVRKHFLRLLDLEPEQRASYLNAHCDEDETLREELESLLEQVTVAERFDDREDLLGQAVQDFFIDDAPPMLPSRIGRYEVLSLLGEGGMGFVYLAKQESPKRTVALKVIRPGSQSAELERRFRFESEALARLEHPGIAQIFDAGKAEVTMNGVQGPSQLFLAMQYVEGENLKQYADENGLSTDDKLELIAKVADAVDHAHTQGIIHRDLKPGNIIVDAHGMPKVLDFGVARATNDDLMTVTMQTQAGQLLGTLAYMSPEQASEDQAQTDTRVDIYALGVIAYELLAGRLPLVLSGLSIAGAASVIRNRHPQKLGSLDTSLGGDIETVVHHALQKDPNQRYATAGAMAEDLRRLKKNQPISVRPPSAAYELRMLIRRHKIPAALVACVFLALIIGTITTVLMLWRALDAETLAEDRLKEETRAREETDQVNRFLDGFLINSNDLLSAKGKKVPYLSVIRNAATALEKADGGDRDGAEYIPTDKKALARIYNRLARDFDLLDEDVLATRMSKRAWDLRKEALGPGDEETVESGIGYLRTVVRNGINPEKALEIADELLPWANALPAKEYGQRQAQVSFEVGQALMYKGMLKDAKRMIEHALQRYLQAGEDKELGADIRAGLAACNRRLGNLKEGERLLREAIIVMGREKGDESIQVTTLKSNLAVNLVGQDRIKDALPLFEEALERRIELMGAESTALLIPESTYATALAKDGQLARSIKILRSNLERHKTFYKGLHRNVGFPTLFLARALSFRGDWQESRALFEELFLIWRKEMPADHHRMGRALYDAAAPLIHQNAPLLASQLVSESEKILIKNFGESNADVARARLRQASCMRMNNELSLAKRTVHSALSKCQEPSFIETQANLELGEIALAESKAKEAILFFQKVEESKRSQDRYLRGQATLLKAQALAENDLQAGLKHLIERYPFVHEEIRGEHWIARSIVDQVSSWLTQSNRAKEAKEWRELLKTNGPPPVRRSSVSNE